MTCLEILLHQDKGIIMKAIDVLRFLLGIFLSSREIHFILQNLASSMTSCFAKLLFGKIRRCTWILLTFRGLLNITFLLLSSVFQSRDLIVVYYSLLLYLKYCEKVLFPSFLIKPLINLKHTIFYLLIPCLFPSSFLNQILIYLLPSF